LAIELCLGNLFGASVALFLQVFYALNEFAPLFIELEKTFELVF